MKYDISIGNKKYVVEIDSESVNILKKSETVSDMSDDDFDDIPDFDFGEDENVNSTSVESPIFGTIVDFKVGIGDRVKKGDIIVLIESMKMENEIVSSADGIVDKLLVGKGDSVKKSQTLLTLISE